MASIAKHWLRSCAREIVCWLLGLMGNLWAMKRCLSQRLLPWTITKLSSANLPPISPLRSFWNLNNGSSCYSTSLRARKPTHQLQVTRMVKTHEHRKPSPAASTRQLLPGKLSWVHKELPDHRSNQEPVPLKRLEPLMVERERQRPTVPPVRPTSRSCSSPSNSKRPKGDDQSW